MSASLGHHKKTMEVITLILIYLIVRELKKETSSRKVTLTRDFFCVRLRFQGAYMPYTSVAKDILADSLVDIL